MLTDEQKKKQAGDLAGTLGAVGTVADMAGAEQGGAVSGATSGATAGATLGGPYGAAIGGVVGGVAGGLAAKEKRKNANIDADVNELKDKDRAQQQANNERRATLTGLAANLSRTLLS